MSIEQQSLDEVMLAYIEAWGTADEQSRRNLLDQCWAKDGVYSDPFYEVHGREELMSHMGQFLHESLYDLQPGHRIPIPGGVDHHHGRICFSWALLDPHGAFISRGLDFGELAEDGCIWRITGFFGPLPPIPDDWPDHLVWQGD